MAIERERDRLQFLDWHLGRLISAQKLPLERVQIAEDDSHRPFGGRL
jgi:hypothetical protein